MELDEILKLTLEQLDDLANEILGEAPKQINFIVAPAIDNESPKESKHGI